MAEVGPSPTSEEKYFRKLYSERNEAESDALTGREGKRSDYWSWEQFHMSVAFLSAQRSKDPNTKVGACIVNKDKKIIGVGHNALPDSESSGWDQEDFKEIWHKKDIETCGFEHTKYAYVCHAAINAILNKNAESTKGCTIYTTHFPAHEDAKFIIQAGITKVVYFEDKYPNHTFTLIAKKLLDKVTPKVEIIKYYSIQPDKPLTHIDIFPLPPTSFGKKDMQKVPGSNPLEHDESFHCPNKDYFMSMACLAARRSKDPTRQVGACIVNKDNKIVGVGYNGFAVGVSDDDPDINWGKSDDDPAKGKHPYVVHAEVNAIMHKTCVDLKDCTMYTTLFPCNECAKVIVQAGIEVIYYLMDDHHDKIYMRASKQLLAEGAKYKIIPLGKADSIKSGDKVCKQYVPSKKCVITTPEIKPTHSNHWNSYCVCL